VPTYQYRCTDCGHAFEQFQSFTDDALTVCPECQGRLRKVFNAVGVVFKGSGFYRTDSRNGSGSTATKEKTSSESSATSDSGSNGSAGKKSEPAKKAEPAKSSSASEKVA
jgi:putative FmdB family regulatory protein